MRLTSSGRLLPLALAALLVTATPAPGASADPERPVDRVSVLPAERAQAQRCPALAPERRPLRVMFVGDSMTQGLSGSATYRYWVWRGLQATGVDAEFVGPRRRTHRAPRNLPARASYEHVDHGFAGQLAHAAEAGATFLTHPDRPRALARRFDPDVVVLQLGYNDANRADGEEIARRTAAFVRSVRRVDEARGGPRTRFVLGQVPRSARSDTIPLAERTAIAREANRLVAERLAEPCLVAVNDLDSDSPPRWRPGRDTFDGRHPNPVGETLLAQRMLDALRRLGVMRGRASVFDPAETWEPDLTVTGERVGGRQWLLDWADAERLAAADRVRLRLVVPGRAPRLTPWTAGTSVVMGLAPGTEVSLVLRRGDAPGRMVAGPGPALVVPEPPARRGPS